MVEVYLICVTCDTKEWIIFVLIFHYNHFRIISEEYNIQMESTDFGKDVASMCDLGYGVLKEGLKTGREEGTLATLAGLVKDGILTVDEAAKRANMTSAEFIAKTGIKE